MTHILQIVSSVKGPLSKSTVLSGELVARLRDQHDSARVTVRDVAAQPIAPLDAAALGALSTPVDRRSPEQQALVDDHDALIAEIQSADIVVFAIPMYNFAVPVQLKAYFDAIARSGVTFRYGATGVEGLLQGKKVHVVFTRGGLHRGTISDSQTAFVQTFLAFVGLTDVEYVYAEGLDMGPDAQATGLEAARRVIAAHFEERAPLRSVA